jgi:hypothetical protein
MTVTAEIPVTGRAIGPFALRGAYHASAVRSLDTVEQLDGLLSLELAEKEADSGDGEGPRMAPPGPPSRDEIVLEWPGGASGSGCRQ